MPPEALLIRIIVTELCVLRFENYSFVISETL